ncbi:MAG: hypothetical protein IKL04_02825, partial [Lachnospiraceae bacterium]|nr:hypothetical protein [Lachnospiraceae bacterium]
MKKKRFAMLAVMLLTIISCMLMTGCGSGKARTESQMKRVAADLLEEKYDEEFEIHYAWPRDSSLFYATCSPKDDMDIVFEMQAYNDGRGLYMDEYLQGAVAKLVEAEIEPKIQEIFEDAYLEVAFTWVTETKDYYEGVTIEEYCQL